MELMHKEFSVNKIDRIAGVTLLGAGAVAALVGAVTIAFPIAIAAIPALIGAFLVLIGGIESSGKWQYFREVVTEREDKVRRYKDYPSLYADEYSKWKSRQHGFNGLKIAKAILTGTPATFVLDSRSTDNYGGRIDSVVEISGFRMFIKEKEHQSDIQMWSSAWANATKLR